MRYRFRQCLEKIARICFALIGLIGISLAAGDVSPSQISPGTNGVTIAVLEFNAGSNDLANASWRVTIRDLIKSQLEDVQGIYVSPDTGYALRALRLRSATDQREARLVGKFIFADWIIWGTYKYENNKWSIKAYLVNTTNNVRPDCISVTSRDLFDVRDQVTSSLLRAMGTPVTETDKRKMLRRWTFSPAALRDFSLAELSSNEGRPWTNIEVYSTQAIKVDPQFSDAYCFLAGVLYDEHKNEAAVRTADRALEIRPDYAAAHEILAIILASENKFADSEKEFKVALLLDPKNAEAFERLGELYRQEKLASSALTNFEEAAALDPFLAVAHARIGDIYADNRDWKKAASELDTAAREALPDDVNAEEQLCMSYAKVHQLPKAIDHGNKYLRLAKKWQEDPALIRFFQDKISQLQSQLTPSYFTNMPPRQYNEPTLDAALRKAIGTNELSLVVNPFAANAGMQRWAAELTAGATNDLQKAQMLFKALVQHPDSLQSQPYTAEQVFSLWDKPGISFHCQEYAFLYVALARSVGLRAYNVDVQETCLGEKCFHACAAVFFGDRYILVDPAYCYFGAPHRKFNVLDDLQSIGVYLSELHGLERCEMGFRLAANVPFTQANFVDALLATSRIQEATEKVAEMVNDNSEGWVTDSERAKLALSQGHYDEAIRFGKRASAISPSSGITHLALARAYFKQGKLSEASDEIHKALGCILPNDELALAHDALNSIAADYYNQANREYNAGNMSGAWTNFSAALEVEPDVAEVYVARGSVEQAQSDFVGALADYNKAIQLKPGLVEAYVNRGGLEQRQNDLGDALADYTEGIRLDPDRGLPYGYRGYLEQAQGDLSGAEADFAKAVKLDENWATGAASEFRALGWLRYQRQEYTNALSDFDRACKLDQTNDYAHFGVWLCTSLLVNSERANDELKRFMATRPAGDSDWPSEVGDFLTGQITEGDLLDAARNADVKKDNEQHCEAYFYIGSKCLISGDKAGGVADFDKCVATGITNFSEYQSAKTELKNLENAQ